MAFLQQFRNKIGRYFLNKGAAVNRYPQVMNFHNAKTIALVYVSSSESSVIMMKQYMKSIKAEYGTRQMMAMAFIDDKEAPFYHQHKLEFDYFARKDLNWFGIPKSDVVKNFINNDYDILVDLTDGEHIPLNYVIKNSRAKFKVGKYSAELEEAYDLCIDVRRSDTLEDYLKQVNYFLNKINKGA